MNNQDNEGNKTFLKYFKQLEAGNSVTIPLNGAQDLKRKIQKDFSQYKARNYLDWVTVIKSKGDVVTIYKFESSTNGKDNQKDR